MKKVIYLAVMIILFLQGCSTKTEYIYIKPEKFEFQKIEQPKVRTIRVYKGDLKLYEEYIKVFRKSIRFHNSQITDYEDSFKGDTSE